MRTSHFLSVVTLAAAATLAGTATPAEAFGRRAGRAAASAQQDLVISGALHAGDPTDGQGHHVRSRAVQLAAGEEVEIAVASSEFDTLLRVAGPGGFALSNDDANGEGTNSRLRFRAPRAGAYQVSVTSYAAGETGEYSLTIGRGASAAGATDETAGADDAGGDEIATDEADDGTPTDDMVAAQNGRAAVAPNVPAVPVAPAMPGAPPQWVFDPARGQFVQMPGTPGAFAQPSMPTMPTMPADPNGAVDPNTPVDPQAGTGTVYGVFVGISDYGGNNLQYTAEDARQLAAAFERSGYMRRGNGIVLTDGRATAANVRQAFQTLSQRVTSRDTFVFFFDGHGNSNSIALRSGSMDGHTLSQLLDTVRGQQLVVLDSCHSGSLAHAVQSRPNRIGLFSSRAEETSYVASEVRSGGWLAYYMIQAARGGVPMGNDGALQLNELVGYVQQGYAQRVNGRQNLVVASGMPGAQRTTLWQTPGRATGAVAMHQR